MHEQFFMRLLVFKDSFSGGVFAGSDLWDDLMRTTAPVQRKAERDVKIAF
ncbi:MAG: hypothetical protein QXG98_00325 [Candidatus Micrarchaeia archaeon]